MRYSCTLRTGAFVGRYGVGRQGVKLLFRMLEQAGTRNLNAILPLQYLFGKIPGGVYWRPVYNLLEGLFTLLVVNAQHIKAVPGRKTDVKDAEWIAELLRHGLLQGSFIPSKPQRQLRELTRRFCQDSRHPGI
jgi:transposase